MPAEFRAILDISVPISPGMVTWPGDPAPDFEPASTVERDGVRVTRLRLGTHTGTHADAPAHFIAGGSAIDALLLSTFVGPCRVADLRHVRDAVRSGDLDTLGPPPRSGERLLLRTRNSDEIAAPRFAEDYVHLTAEAARTLVEARVRLIGVDYLSVEGFHARRAPAHHILLASGVAILETLDLRAVDPGEYVLVAAPLRLAGLDGSPVRALLIRE